MIFKHPPPEYTLLDHFAGLAMAAAISRSELFQIMDNECLKAHADLYYRMAEAMLHARDRRQQRYNQPALQPDLRRPGNELA